MGERYISRRAAAVRRRNRAAGGPKTGEQLSTRDWLLLSALLFGLVVSIGLMQRFGVTAPVDHLAMKVVAYARLLPGSAMITAVSLFLDQAGSGGGRITIALLLALGLAQTGHPTKAIWMVLASCGIVLVNPLVKTAFGAARPDVIERLIDVHSFSFPSGHAAGSMALYGAIALIFRLPLLWIGCAAIVLATGLSRVWLGVHWPSDVVGGWIEGAAWLALCAGVFRARRLNR